MIDPPRAIFLMIDIHICKSVIYTYVYVNMYRHMKGITFKIHNERTLL